MTPLRLFRSVVREELRTLWLVHRSRAVLVLLCAAIAGAVFWPVAGTGRPVTAFVYTYGLGEGAGLRAWTLDGVGRWHERNPDGREARVFDVTMRGVVGGCPGSLTHETAHPAYVFFVPDMGCRAMGLMLQRNGAAWSTLGGMSIASSEPQLGQ